MTTLNIHGFIHTPTASPDTREGRIKAIAGVDWTPERKAKYRRNQEKANKP